MKFEDASRDGWTSSPSPKKRQKLIMRGRHFSGSICGSRCVSRKQRLVNVQFHDGNFKRVGGDIFSERPPVVDSAFHLHRALLYARRRHRQGWNRSQISEAKFLGLVTVSPTLFFLGHRIFASGESQAIHVSDLLIGRQVDYALSRSNQVVGCLAHGSQA